MAGDNREEFTDPRNYDLEQEARSQRRVAWCVALADELGGPVLEIGCGTGIVALPLARRGHAVTGVDAAPAMLAHARAKAEAQGLEIDWMLADARRLALGRLFRLVLLTGHTFQAFLARADQDALLQAVARHLAPGGELVFETRNPAGHDLGPVDDEAEGEYVDADGRRVGVSYSQRYDAAMQVMHWTTHRRWREGAREVRVDRRIDCRFTGPEELEEMLRAHGFAITARIGDWDGRAFEPRDAELILRCRRA